jgi:hypothetical protein
MDEQEEKQGGDSCKVGPRCDPEQLTRLRKCSEKKDMNEWNKWRVKNRFAEIWLQGAELCGAYLEEADIRYVHLEGANLTGAHLKKAKLEGTHLEEAQLVRAHLWNAEIIGGHLEKANITHAKLVGANLYSAHLEMAKLQDASLEGADVKFAHLEATEFTRANLKGADFSASVVDGSTLFWMCDIDPETDFRGVGLDSCRIDEKTKYDLEYNRRRMNCEDWYKLHPRLAWTVKIFFWMSDYGNSTWRIIKTFFLMAVCFAIIYYIWGALDYYLLDVPGNPGIVANLFIDQYRPVIGWLVPLRSFYFSIVTMTTLGFGDMYANTNNYWFAAICGHLLLMLQVLLGYCLLGALVTRFAVLFKSGLITDKLKNKQ